MRDVVRDLSAYLRMVGNPGDEVAMGRVRSMPACSPRTILGHCLQGSLSRLHKRGFRSKWLFRDV
jgi:hypothetical protein